MKFLRKFWNSYSVWIFAFVLCMGGSFEAVVDCLEDQLMDFTSLSGMWVFGFLTCGSLFHIFALVKKETAE